MRRKVIQDFANVLCQNFIDLCSGYDTATFAHLGSGIYSLDVLSGECSRNDESIPKLDSCDRYKNWLKEQCESHKIPFDSLHSATMLIVVNVSELKIKRSYNRVHGSAKFDYDCRSEISTDEKSYVSQMSGSKVWGLEYYYEKLYGSLVSLEQAD